MISAAKEEFDSELGPPSFEEGRFHLEGALDRFVFGPEHFFEQHGRTVRDDHNPFRRTLHHGAGRFNAGVAVHAPNGSERQRGGICHADRECNGRVACECVRAHDAVRSSEGGRIAFVSLSQGKHCANPDDAIARPSAIVGVPPAEPELWAIRLAGTVTLERDARPARSRESDGADGAKLTSST